MLHVPVTADSDLPNTLAAAYGGSEETVAVECPSCHAKGARMTTAITKLPNLLVIDLKRHSSAREGTVKIMDYFPFYTELDMSEYGLPSTPLPLPPSPPPPEKGTEAQQGRGGADAVEECAAAGGKYTLTGIVVHVGNESRGVSTGGHYYSYIRTGPDTWHKFNDEKVTAWKQERMSDDCYGNKDGGPRVRGPHIPLLRHTCA